MRRRRAHKVTPRGGREQRYAIYRSRDWSTVRRTPGISCEAGLNEDGAPIGERDGGPTCKRTRLRLLHPLVRRRTYDAHALQFHA